MKRKKGFQDSRPTVGDLEWHASNSTFGIPPKPNSFPLFALLPLWSKPPSSLDYLCSPPHPPRALCPYSGLKELILNRPAEYTRYNAETRSVFKILQWLYATESFRWPRITSLTQTHAHITA